MAYTEIKQKNEKRYYYRVRSIRVGNKFKKKRIYLGKDLAKKELLAKEENADIKLRVLDKKRFGFERLKPKIIAILKKYGVKKAGIFGSYAEGRETKKSDIDILIKPTKHMGFQFAGLEIELSEKLHKKVDLVSYNGLSPFLKDRILRQEIRII